MPFISGCNSNQFQCDNGNCVDEPRCNLFDNCGDNSDELNCNYGKNTFNVKSLSVTYEIKCFSILNIIFIISIFLFA